MDLSPTIDKLREMSDGFLAALPNLVVALVVAIILYLLSRALRRSVWMVLMRSGGGAYAALVTGRLVQWATLALGTLIVLSIVFPSINAQTLVSVLGIGSLAIGFAFRDIAQNFLAGFLILLTRPFHIGDQIDINGFEGTVEDIQTRATHIRTYDGRVVVVPNADFLTDTVIVNTAYDIRRSECEVGISYTDDISLAKALILAELQGIDGILKEPAPDVLTATLSDSSVNLKVRWWTNSTRSDIVSSTDLVITATKKALDRGGVEIPFPIRTLYINRENETEFEPTQESGA